MFWKKKNKEKVIKPEIVETKEPVSEDVSLAVQIEQKRAIKKEADKAKKILGVSLAFNIFFLMIICFVTYWGIIVQKDVYFATTSDGRIQRLIPLNKPYVSDAGLMNWATNAITETYTFDFYNYKKSLSKVQKDYSSKAWKELLTQVKPMIDSVVDKRLMLFAMADEAPRMLKKGVNKDGVYTWTIEFPMTITNQAIAGTQDFKWLVQIVVSRADIGIKSSGIEIVQFIISPR